MNSDGRLLIVRHGPDRGRLQPYIQQCFDTLCEGNPALRDRLAFYPTGDTLPSLEGVTGVLFLLADPLDSLYPECHADASSIADRAVALGIPLYNPPTLLSAHSKSRTASVLGAHGIECPPAYVYRDLEQLRRLLESHELPVILRADSDHAQLNARVLEKPGDVEDLEVGPVPYPGVLSPMVDVRIGRKRDGPWDPFHKWVHRYRAFVFGDICMPGHLHFSPSRVVGGDDVIWERMDESSRRIAERLGTGRLNGLAQRGIRMSPWYRAARAADIEFRRHGPPDPSFFVSAARALGYDFVAFDYGVHPDGRPIIFEANPYPFINPMPGGILWRERELDEYTRRMYDAIGRYLISRTGSLPGETAIATSASLPGSTTA